jgi:hypothetical protein
MTSYVREGKWVTRLLGIGEIFWGLDPRSVVSKRKNKINETHNVLCHIIEGVLEFQVHDSGNTARVAVGNALPRVGVLLIRRSGGSGGEAGCQQCSFVHISWWC